MRPRRRFTRRFPRLKLAVGLITVVWSLVEVLRVKNALVQHLDFEQGSLGGERIFVAGMHWNSEGILRGAWIPAVVDLINAVGRDNIFISIHESGSWDDTKGALRVFDDHLGQYGVPRRVIMDNTTHEDEIKNPPVGAGDGWIEAPNGEVERRRIPWLSNLRNLVLEPLYEQQKAGIVYDKILFLNDVVFTVSTATALSSSTLTSARLEIFVGYCGLGEASTQLRAHWTFRKRPISTIPLRFGTPMATRHLCKVGRISDPETPVRL